MMRPILRLWRADVGKDVDEEMRFHIDSAIEEYVASGMSREAAHAQALVRFGDVSSIAHALHSLSQQRERTMDRKELLHSIMQDARVAVRQLRRNAGFTTVAVLTLALGIGATSAIFSVVNSVLLRPLPYANSGELLQLRERNGTQDTEGMVVSYGNFASWAEQVRSFDALGAYTGDNPRTLTGSGDPLALRVTRASAGYWKALYIPPAAGRYFTAEEDAVGAEPVVVISESLWESRFSRDPAVVNKLIMLNGVAHRVVGVAPKAYALSPQQLGTPGIWLPLALTTAQKAEHADHELFVVGVLHKGVTSQGAIAELNRIEAGLAREYPHAYFDGVVLATSLRDAIVGNVRSILLMLFGAVALVLLIACANVTNLLLARDIARQKEMAIRSALGGGRTRILRQLLIESLVLALTGAVVGLVVAAASIRVLVRSAPANVPRLQDVSLDLSMVAFSMLLALVTGILFGLLPAIRASRPDLQTTLRDGGRDSGGNAHQRLRPSLVVGQVSIAFVLLVGASLLLRSGIRLQNVPPGFETKNVLVTTVSLPAARYGAPERARMAFEQITGAVSAVPGVQSAGFITRIPIGAGGIDCAVIPEGAPSGDAGKAGANQRIVTPAFFQTLGIPLLRGRGFVDTDRAGAPLVVVINRMLAQRLYGAENAVGKRVSSCTGDGPPVFRTVVGVIGDIKARGLANDVPTELYYPLEQLSDQSTMSLVVRGKVPVNTLIPAVRGAIAGVDAQLPLMNVTTMEEVVSKSLAVPHFTTMLLGTLGGLGFALAVIGVYGVVAYFVVQRTREIGVRIALGARPLRVVRFVVGQGVLLVAIGTGVGLVIAWLSAGVLQQLLFEVNPHDPAVFALVAAALIGAAVAACAVPAWRAARVDPSVAMRG